MRSTLDDVADSPVAVVTGGAGFIGSAIVAALADCGHQVVTLDRVGDEGVDLADEAQVRAAARDILARHGRCDVLVHAGVNFSRSTLNDLSANLFHQVMAVNVESVLWLAQELTPQMASRGFGRVVMVVSDTFFDPPPAADMLPYIASKGALVGASRALARSLGADGITVNCVAPGLTSPETGPGPVSAVTEAVVLRQALPRPLVPEDVASVVAFLASPGAQAVTGQTICADGGLVMR